MVSDITSLRGPVASISPTELADRAAVAEVARLYALAMDMRDLDMLLSLFASDAEISGMLGVSRAADYLPRLIGGLAPFAVTLHSISNQYVVVEGDSARMWSYCRAYHLFAERGRPPRIANVIYKDQLKRTPDGWIIIARESAHQWREGWDD